MQFKFSYNAYSFKQWTHKGCHFEDSLKSETSNWGAGVRIKIFSNGEIINNWTIFGRCSDKKQPSRGFPKKRWSEDMQQIYRRTPMRKCDINEAVSNFIEIALRHGCSPVNLLHIFRTLFPRNTSGRLLLSDNKSELFPFLPARLLSGAPNNKTDVAADNEMVVSSGCFKPWSLFKWHVPWNTEEVDECLLLQTLDAQKVLTEFL